jgi:hypothetical protein
MIRALRWLLVAPMAALGWIIAFTTALATHSFIDTYCPEQYKVSNSCNWEWAILAQDILIVVGATISAVLFVSFATVTAPAYKARVATAAFLVGLSAATWAFLQTDALSAFIGAGAGGVLALVITLRWHARRNVSGYRQYQLFV